MKRPIAALLACSLAFSSPLAFGDDKDEAKVHFAAGQEAYKGGAYEKAISEFEEAYKLDKNPVYLYNIAVAYELWGKPDKAAKYYEKYLPDADPKEKAELEAKIKVLKAEKGEAKPEEKPKEAAKPEEKPSEAEKPKEAPAAAATTLEVRSEPAGAQVWLEEKRGEPAGKTPFVTRLDPGKHTVVLELPGHLPMSRSIEVLAGQAATLDITMSKADAPALVAIQANVLGARIYLDDRSQGVAGTTPFQTMMAPGKHTVIAEKEGYEPLTKEIEIKAGEAGPIPIALELKKGSYGQLRVSSNIRGAIVEVDGKKVGAVPFGADLPKVAVGEHEISISSPGYSTWEGTIEVESGATVQVKTELAKKPRKAGAVVAFLIAGGLVGSGLYLGQQAQSIFSDLEQDIDAGLPVDDNDPRFQAGFMRGLAADAAFGLGGISLLVSITKFASKGKKSKGDVFNSVVPSASGELGGGALVGSH